MKLTIIFIKDSSFNYRKNPLFSLQFDSIISIPWWTSKCPCSI